MADRPDPVIEEPTDAIVRVVLAGVCGSDLWYWRGESPHAVGSIGHEFIGFVEEVGAQVEGVAAPHRWQVTGPSRSRPSANVAALPP